MQVITGKPEYVKRRIHEFAKNGYAVVKTTRWSDGTVTVNLSKSLRVN